MPNSSYITLTCIALHWFGVVAWFNKIQFNPIQSESDWGRDTDTSTPPDLEGGLGGVGWGGGGEIKIEIR